MSDKKKTKRLELEICAIIENIRKDLKKIKDLTDGEDAEKSVICDEARSGARKLMMARKIGK